MLFEDARLLSLSQFAKVSQNLRNKIASNVPDDLLDYWQNAVRPLGYDPLSEEFAAAQQNHNVTLHSNTNVLETIVDYSRPFYLNSRRRIPSQVLATIENANPSAPEVGDNATSTQATKNESLLFRFSSGAQPPKVLADRGAKAADAIEMRITIREIAYRYVFYDLTLAPHRVCVPPTGTLGTGQYVHVAPRAEKSE